ncbi:MAG: translation elongation factor 4 [Christensenellaceae bacterium]|jgi:GTP-binding protein LepA|nr:translation elongation factor 4 [Christensenellaceae bacterium]
MRNHNGWWILSRQDYIRNFCIVAHIDHGKSTLADRLLEKTGTVAKRDMAEQLLDSMDIERERGITIKLTPTRMFYDYNGERYTLNLIDTPGHVDFTYEVSRSLRACEGALLIVDAAQGVEAQTLANAYLALDNGLEVLPVINKIDLPAARPEEVKAEIKEIIGIESALAPCISAKSGQNVEEVLEQICALLPPPSGDEDAPLKCLIFDCYYDNFKGAVCLIRVVDGEIEAGTKIKMMQTGKSFDVVEVGIFSPKQSPVAKLSAGDVGYICASIKTVREVKVGDTITDAKRPCAVALDGYKEIKPVVFSGIFPVDGARYMDLKDALEKLKLNDASLEFSQETSNALGYGFRVGFLGLLHLEIITERLEREFKLELITTAPSVNYKVHKTSGDVLDISNPSNLPSVVEIDYIEEPIVDLKVYTPPEYIGALMDLSTNKRGVFVDMQYTGESRVVLNFKMPLNEIVYDYFDLLKSASRGYASLDYEDAGYVRSNLVKLEVKLNGDTCDALSIIVHKDRAYEKGKNLTERLKEVIPRQMFEIPIQACIGNTVIARETVKAMRKDVLAKCYGGDITRKMKLLEKQKEGKKKMRTLGSVEVPSEAFITILKI